MNFGAVLAKSVDFVVVFELVSGILQVFEFEITHSLGKVGPVLLRHLQHNGWLSVGLIGIFVVELEKLSASLFCEDLGVDVGVGSSN